MLFLVLLMAFAFYFYAWKRQHIISKDEKDDNLLYPTSQGFFSFPRDTRLGKYVLSKQSTVNLSEIATVHDYNVFSPSNYRMHVAIWAKPSLYPYGVVFCQPRYVAKSCLFAIVREFHYCFNDKSEGQEGDAQLDKKQRMIAKMRKMRPAMATSMHTIVNAFSQFGYAIFIKVTILDINLEKDFPKMTIEIGDDELKKIINCHHISENRIINYS